MHIPLSIETYKIAPRMVGWLSANIRRYDVVHAHALFSFAPTVTAWMCRAYGVPYIIRPLGTLASYSLSKRRQLLKRLSIRCIEAASAPCCRRALHLRKRAGGGTATRHLFRGVHHSFGRRYRRSNRVRRSCVTLHPQLTGRSVVLYLSRIDPKKNIEALIDAFGCSRKLQDSASLVIAGRGEPGYMEL